MRRDDSIVSDVSCWATAVLIVLGLFVLGLRLWHIQIQDAAQYNYAHTRQSVRRVQVAGSRGRILDRRGVVLADNRRVNSLMCLAEVFQARTRTGTVHRIQSAIENLAQAVGLPSSPLSALEISNHLVRSSALPLAVWRDVDFRAVARFSEQERNFPGFDLQEAEERVYPHGSLAAHVLGYVGRGHGTVVAGDERFNYQDFELFGREGLERYYNDFLRGGAGERKILVDALGFATRSWTVVEPQRGPDLQLTLDCRIQRSVEGQLEGVRGACVVMDPRTGEVLALASSPSYDLSDFVPFVRPASFRRYSEDPGLPFLNRATGGCYAPGSTFKPVTALAALGLGYPADATYECTGVFSLPGMNLRCTRRWGHGSLDLRYALRESCNPFFCNLGLEAGTNALVAAARALGLGRRTGLDAQVDASGIVPDEHVCQVRNHRPWYPGDLAQMSIGQGLLTVTPLQMACLIGGIGTGFLAKPHFKAGLPVARRPLPFPAQDLNVVREGLRLVVDGGTGRRGGEGVAVAVAGKTGTAEVDVRGQRCKNAWFVAYAPFEHPTVAVAMVVENGESGGLTAAPRVAKVLKTVFGEVRRD